MVSPYFVLAQSAGAMNASNKSVSHLAAYCGGPIHPPTSVAAAGKRLDVAGTYKPGLSSQAIVNFEVLRLDLKLGRCIAYIEDASKGSVNAVDIYASPRQIHLYQGYVVYYMEQSQMFKKVTATAAKSE